MTITQETVRKTTVQHAAVVIEVHDRMGHSGASVDVFESRDGVPVMKWSMTRESAVALTEALGKAFR